MFKSVASILLGTGSAQVLVFISMPILARVYSPESFAAYAYLGSVAGIATIFATLQLQHAIIIPNSDKQANRIEKLISLFSFILGCITALSVFLLSDTKLLPIQVTAIEAAITGSLVFALGKSQAKISLAVRNKSFKLLGTTSIIRAIALISTQIVFSNLSTNGLILGQLIAELLFIFAIDKSLEFKKKLHIDGRHIFVLLRKNRDFVGSGTAQELLNSVSQSLPLFMLGFFYGPLAAGAYAFASRITMGPAQLLSNSVRHVYTARYAEILKMGKLRQKYYFSNILPIAVPAFLISIVTMPFVEYLFSFTFGAQWSESGAMASWIILWAALAATNAPATVVMRLLRKQNISLKLNTIFLIVRAIVLCLSGILIESATTTIAFFCIVSVVLNAYYIFVAGRLLPSN